MFFMILFVILSFFLITIILIQQGKGDLGLGSMSGTQMLFGGSGGQNIFEKATWIMGMVFILGALGLAILKTKEHRASVLEGVTVPKKAIPALPQAATPAGSTALNEQIDNSLEQKLDIEQQSENLATAQNDTHSTDETEA